MSLKSCVKTENSHYKLTVEVEAEKFAAACDEQFKKQAKNITVPGFRRGKAPRSIIEKMYGKGFIYEDAVNAIYKEYLDAAIAESGLELVSDHIDLEVESVGEEGLVFTAVVAVKPEVKIEGYKGIEAEKLIAKVTDEQVEAEITAAQKRGARMTNIDDRAAQNGDTVVFDFAGYVDGVAFDGGTAENFSLVLGSGQFIPGFEDQMVGHSIGEEFDVNVTFPEEYHAEELKGKPAVFKIKLHEIKVEELPELDDEFAADNGYDTLAEYKAGVAADLMSKAEKASDRAFDEKLMMELTELIDADIPEEMYRDTAERELEQWAYRLQMQGLSLDDYMKFTGMDIEALLENFRPQAVVQVKIRLALEEIAKLESLEASEEEITAEYEKLAAQYERTVDEVKSLIPEDGIKHDILVEKAMNLVRESAKAVMVEKLSHDDDCDCDECHHDDEDSE